MNSSKVKVSAVKYANTYPFIHGLKMTGFDRKIILTTDHPAECAKKLAEGIVDVGLIPVAALPRVKDYRIITDYCLGAYGKVRTVMLLSNTPFSGIRKIHLDYRSLSSVNLARILARNFWKRDFIWNNTSEGFDFINIGDNEAVVLIGDQCFEYENRFSYKTDLAEEWFRFTGLPFAFACWTANKPLGQDFHEEFNLALKYGVDHIAEVVERYGSSGVIRGAGLFEYLTKNMNFELNNDKRKAIDLFLTLMG